MKRGLLLLLSAIFIFNMTSCKKAEDNPEDQEYPITYQDVKIAEKPLHIVSLSPAVTSVLQRLGVEEERLAGVSDNCVASDTVKRMGSVFAPDTEAMETAGADVVFASSALSGDAAAALGKAGIPVVILASPKDAAGLSKYYEDIAMAVFGRLTGRPLASEKLTGLIEEIKAPFASSPRLTGAYIGDQVYATRDTFLSYLMSLCGIDNVVSADAMNWEYSAVKVAAQNPQLILCGVGQKPAIAADGQLAGTLAVTQGLVIEVDSSLAEQFGDSLVTFSHRIAEGLSLPLPPVSSEGAQL